ncbi:hypothetical protein KY334_04525 [Candidatus Woesearchaeota archaeon]|nr:hypothetical protein [Candidatus Woesearchaeota archaeon]
MAFNEEPNINFDKQECYKKYNDMIKDGKIDEVKKLLEDKKKYLELFNKNEVDDTLENIFALEKEIEIISSLLSVETIS